MGLRGILWPSEPERLKPTVFQRWKNKRGRGLAEGQMDGGSSHQGQDLDLLAQANRYEKALQIDVKLVVSAKKIKISRVREK